MSSVPPNVGEKLLNQLIHPVFARLRVAPNRAPGGIEFWRSKTLKCDNCLAYNVSKAVGGQVIPTNFLNQILNKLWTEQSQRWHNIQHNLNRQVVISNILPRVDDWWEVMRFFVRDSKHVRNCYSVSPHPSYRGQRFSFPPHPLLLKCLGGVNVGLSTDSTRGGAGVSTLYNIFWNIINNSLTTNNNFWKYNNYWSTNNNLLLFIN